MLERQIEQKLRLAVKAKGGLALKFVSPGTAGVPDRIVLAPDGRVFFVELKAPGGILSPKQVKMAHTLFGLGHVVWVINNQEQIQELVGLL
ncbi:VRR-NUC domain-containing protein [Desulfosporosinus sp. Sb-LF]|uniref:VRR-NUC domain-containing protein n=1 Tax=Desulfosporosinus sp. Sb-LF TaxID=2560027 RepID=UPI00107F007F|nr:VRR-NUC domain-containing protein [Desulfosporosinus sp. Sb-LF]TGE33346.1 VRR-NUC domain-containing protein [Desulfosporosinus sp. Sb-LF]